VSGYRVTGLHAASPEDIERAAELLFAGFAEHWPNAWPTLPEARQELREALAPERTGFVARDSSGIVVGWIGGIPMYDGRVWELHPLVVDRAHRGRGVARLLVSALEQAARDAGGLTLWLGTDDEDNLTSLGGVELFPGLLDRLREIRSLGGHPFGLYQRLGFELAGVVPDANGFGKPDILMAKSLRR
jgi:aminoglycoside 6'-N-acetyltransferase I